jgi:hypothetical protein
MASTEDVAELARAADDAAAPVDSPTEASAKDLHAPSSSSAVDEDMPSAVADDKDATSTALAVSAECRACGGKREKHTCSRAKAVKPSHGDTVEEDVGAAPSRKSKRARRPTAAVLESNDTDKDDDAGAGEREPDDEVVKGGSASEDEDSESSEIDESKLYCLCRRPEIPGECVVPHAPLSPYLCRVFERLSTLALRRDGCHSPTMARCGASSVRVAIAFVVWGCIFICECRLPRRTAFVARSSQPHIQSAERPRTRTRLSHPHCRNKDTFLRAMPCRELRRASCAVCALASAARTTFARKSTVRSKAVSAGRVLASPGHRRKPPDVNSMRAPSPAPNQPAADHLSVQSLKRATHASAPNTHTHTQTHTHARARAHTHTHTHTHPRQGYGSV